MKSPVCIQVLDMNEMALVSGGGYHEEKGPVVSLPPAPTPVPDGTLTDI